DFADIKGAAAILGHDGEDGVVPAGDRVIAGDDRRWTPNVLGQIAQDGLDLAKRVRLVLGDVVDAADGGVDLRAAELELVDVDTHGDLDHGRSAHEEAGRVAGHHREVAKHGAARCQPRGGPQ